MQAARHGHQPCRTRHHTGACGRRWHWHCKLQAMTMTEKLELIDELSHLRRQLSGPALATPGASNAVSKLIEIARALGVPTTHRRDDAPVFLDGTEKLETATWTQCGGILYAIAHDEVSDRTAVAAKVAQRIFELAPTHRRAS